MSNVESLSTIYNNKTVFLTGHTGFKGSWLAYWLTMLGAKVVGYSLEPNTTPNHYNLLNLDISSYIHDIDDLDFLKQSIRNTKPDIIFHLAAQPLVRYSYLAPIETFRTNVMGTAHILEAARGVESIQGIVVITTDKCYENIEQAKGYVESDRMGGHDPYSSSKGSAELVISAYRNSFFHPSKYNSNHQTLIASARAGNVIGGGDWSLDRLLPDIIKGAIQNTTTVIRSPNATRPWQHVLEPLSGYLILGQKLLQRIIPCGDAYNFGPEENKSLTVKEVLDIATALWPKIQYTIDQINEHPHEANLLSLNIHKAKSELSWTPIWNNEQSIEKTIEWYRNYYSNQIIDTEKNIKEYTTYMNKIKSNV